jgi:DNA-binding PadR family transcriptional regulator
MLKGLLKMSMLKIIAENKATGYQIIKKVTELTGEKPSTGSIYPLLKSMQTKGQIKGTTQNGKTTYEITPSGQATLTAHGSLKEYYEQKLNGSISLVRDTFNEKETKTGKDNAKLAEPILRELEGLLAHGVKPKKIKPIISDTVKQLQQLLED